VLQLIRVCLATTLEQQRLKKQIAYLPRSLKR
jgi:hypothetical protein